MKLSLALSACLAIPPFLLSAQSASQEQKNDDPHARWESAILAFEKADQTTPPPKGQILFLGSSSIRMWKTLQADFPTFTIIQRGFGGSQISDSTAFANRIILPYAPRQIVLYAGDNDIAGCKSPQTVLEDFRQFVQMVHAQLPKTRISFIAIKPSLARWKLIDSIKEANLLIQQFTEKDLLLDYIDIFTPMLGPDQMPRKELFIEDGLHLCPAGYQLWTSTVEPHLSSSTVPR